jgi:hypothetical protein
MQQLTAVKRQVISSIAKGPFVNATETRAVLPMAARVAPELVLPNANATDNAGTFYCSRAPISGTGPSLTFFRVEN